MDRDIEQAADAATPSDPVFQAVREAITAKVGLFDLDGAKTVSIDELTRAVVAAAVPATAEQIAAQYDALAVDTTDPSAKGAYFLAAGIARSFAASLSADTTGGDSDWRAARDAGGNPLPPQWATGGDDDE